MKQQQETMSMLELIIQPAFCVQNGVVVKVNKAAESRIISPGTEIARLLVTGQQEYAEFTDGCLYLTLDLSGQEQGASVVRMKDFDVFVLDLETDQPELRALALASQMLREPLSAMMVAAGRLFSKIESCADENLRSDVAAISKSEFQLLRILGNMSDANRYMNNASYTQKVQNITALLADLFEHLSALTMSKDIEIHFSNLRDPVYCLVDEEKLERAISNIISNALKFTPQNGIIDAKLIRKGTKLYLTIQDSGCGIPSDERLSIHSRYLREPGLEDGRHGIGLGMVLIRAAASAHGGTVLVEYPKDHGLRITVTIEIRQNTNGTVRTLPLMVDYAGEWDHGLIELSESLPASMYRDNIPHK